MTTQVGGRVRWRRSLRTRIVAMAGILTLTAIAVFAMLASVAVAESAKEQLRQRAVSQVVAGAAAYAFSGTLGSHYSLDPRWPPSVLHQVAAPNRPATYYDGTYMWAVLELPGGEVISTRLPDQSIHDQLADLHRRAGQAAIFILVATLLGAYLWASTITARLRAAASALAQGEREEGEDRGRRHAAADDSIRSAPEDDEVTLLTRAIERATQQLAQRLEHERTFSADLAHELRTPLTALVSAAELLPDAPEATRIRAAVTRMRRLVEDLIELAKLESPTHRGAATPHDLATLVRTIVASLDPLLTVQFRVDSSRPVLVSTPHLTRVMTNLISNAHRHGRPPVIVTVDRTSLHIQDHGVGYPPDLLAHGPRRLHPIGPTAGTGLGLTIAMRHVHATHGTLTLENSTAGARATIHLTPAAAGRSTC